MNMQGLIDPALILPELVLCGLIGLLLVLDLVLPRKRHTMLGSVSAMGLSVALILALVGRGAAGLTLGGAYLADPLSGFFKAFFLLAAVLVTVMSREYVGRLDRGVGEFYILVAIAALGMACLSGAHHLLAMFVALEVITVSFYVLTAIHHLQPRSLEAGTKYLIMGAVSSAILLYGISFLYGATGSMQLSEIRAVLAQGPLPSLAVLGMVLIVAGLGFKIACFPFQLWAPDVYQGAPTPAAAFLSVGSKAAGFLLFLRLLTGLVGPLPSQWVLALAGLSALTIFYGNLGALWQSNMKRLLGYSTIGHAGYLLMGIAAGGTLGTGAVLYYLCAYLFTNLAAFMVLVVVVRGTEGEDISRFDGLYRRSPFLAAAMFLALLSLAGVPPLAGFTGKFLLLLAAVRSDLIWLAAIGAVNVVISLYYYLTIVRAMYLREPADGNAPETSWVTKAALIVCMMGILGLGVAGEPLLHAATAAAGSLF